MIRQRISTFQPSLAMGAELTVLLHVNEHSDIMAKKLSNQEIAAKLSELGDIYVQWFNASERAVICQDSVNDSTILVILK